MPAATQQSPEGAKERHVPALTPGRTGPQTQVPFAPSWLLYSGGRLPGVDTPGHVLSALRASLVPRRRPCNTPRAIACNERPTCRRRSATASRTCVEQRGLVPGTIGLDRQARSRAFAPSSARGVGPALGAGSSVPVPPPAQHASARLGDDGLKPPVMLGQSPLEAGWEDVAPPEEPGPEALAYTRLRRAKTRKRACHVPGNGP